MQQSGRRLQRCQFFGVLRCNAAFPYNEAPGENIVLAEVGLAQQGGTNARWEERSTARVLDVARQRAVKRSRQIVEAARAIVREEGLDALTVQAVLDRTGLSLRAFYQRFAGKDELLLAAFEESVRDAVRFFGAESTGITDPVERLRATVTGLFARALEDESAKQSVPLSREHLRLAEAHPAELRHAMEPLSRLLEEQITAAIEAGRARRTDPRRLAVLVVNLVSAQIHAVLLGTVDQHDVERSGDELWDFCWRAIRAEGS